VALEIRPMTAVDVARAIGWAAAEGWNPGRGDLGPFMAEDPGGFLMGWLGGEPVWAISVVRCGEGLGYLGLYLVAPGHRGKGQGVGAWNAGQAGRGGGGGGVERGAGAQGA